MRTTELCNVQGGRTWARDFDVPGTHALFRLLRTHRERVHESKLRLLRAYKGYNDLHVGAVLQGTMWSLAALLLLLPAIALAQVRPPLLTIVLALSNVSFRINSQLSYPPSLASNAHLPTMSDSVTTLYPSLKSL